ncbi:hypothetical protein LCGC14_2280630 [marine sediment metagenome]|uniref:Uncharacterized protein n=1 Tax=marine sediment metagenome TaxID=412755 RepID=A0A0F9FPG1_9ZZZZ
MAMRWMDDVGAPLAVTAIDLVTETVAPQWNEYAAYGTAVGAWVANQSGMARSDFVKNMAIAATPWAAKAAYQRIRGMLGISGAGIHGKGINRWPAPLIEQPFGGARLT